MSLSFKASKSFWLNSSLVSKLFGDRETQELCWDNESTVETVCLLSNRKPDTKVRVDVDLEDYYRIKDEEKNQN